MSQKTSLMEWLYQTRRLAKEEDYMGLSIVDTIMDNIWLVNGEKLAKYKNGILALCERYHKSPTPWDFFGNRKKIETEFKKQTNGKSLHSWQQRHCRSHDEPYRECGMYGALSEAVTEQIVLQLERCSKAREVLIQQWQEAIDFCLERPELCDPIVLSDDYIVSTISAIAKEWRKKNPFENGFRNRLGKYWRDKDGHWRKEKRNRF